MALTPESKWQRRLGDGGALLVALIGMLTLVEYLFAWDLGIDQLLFRDTSPAPSGLSPGTCVRLLFPENNGFHTPSL